MANYFTNIGENSDEINVLNEVDLTETAFTDYEIIDFINFNNSTISNSNLIQSISNDNNTNLEDVCMEVDNYDLPSDLEDVEITERFFDDINFDLIDNNNEYPKLEEILLNETDLNYFNLNEIYYTTFESESIESFQNNCNYIFIYFLNYILKYFFY